MTKDSKERYISVVGNLFKNGNVNVCSQHFSLTEAEVAADKCERMGGAKHTIAKHTIWCVKKKAARW